MLTTPTFKVKFLLLFWAWITLGIWIIFEIISFLVFKNNLTFWTLTGAGSCIAFYFIIKVISSYKYRKNIYIRLHNKLAENPTNIKRSILYRLDTTPCGKVTTKILCKEFNVNL